METYKSFSEYQQIKMKKGGKYENELEESYSGNQQIRMEKGGEYEN